MTRRSHSIQAWLVNWLGATVLVGIFFALEDALSAGGAA